MRKEKQFEMTDKMREEIQKKYFFEDEQKLVKINKYINIYN